MTRKDPTISRGPSFSMGGRYPDEIDKLSSNNPFYPGGTHRAEYGEDLLTHGRCFDKKSQDALVGGLSSPRRVLFHWERTVNLFLVFGSLVELD